MVEREVTDHEGVRRRESKGEGALESGFTSTKLWPFITLNPLLKQNVTNTQNLLFLTWIGLSGLYTHVDAPFHRTSSGIVLDSCGRKVFLFPDTRRVLQELRTNNVPIAFASRTTDPIAAEALLKSFLLHDHGETPSDSLTTLWDCLSSRDHFQAYPSRGGRAKTKHFSEIMKAHEKTFSCIGFHDVVFFDDAEDNIEVATESGVVAIYLERGEGLTYELFTRGLERWRQGRGKK